MPVDASPSVCAHVLIGVKIPVADACGVNDGARWNVPVIGVGAECGNGVVFGLRPYVFVVRVGPMGVECGAGVVLAGFPGVTRGALDAGPV